MIRVDLSVRRVYVAAFAAIGYVLMHRSVTSFDWPPSRALGAIASDATALAVLFALFAILDRWLQPKSLAARGHKAFHFVLALTTIAFATGAQVLYQKTGEVLDIGIVRFFVENFKDLTGATQSIIDQEVLLMVVACFGFYLLSLIRMRTPLLRSLQYALFLSPLLLLALDFTYELADNHNDAPMPIAERAIYKGKYANRDATEIQWLVEERPFWREGVISSLFSSVAGGITEYNLIEKSVKPIKTYTSPQKSSSARITPNILFVLLESTRADVVGTPATGDNAKSYAPFLDTLARESWNYESAYTTIPHTSKALVGIYCGSFAKFGTDGFESTKAQYPLNCLPRLLAHHGYRSGHFQTAPGTFEGRSQFLSNVGFSHTVVQEDLSPKQQTRYGYLGLDDRLLVTPMLDWMQKQHEEGHPFFASMLTVMTHHPYVSPGNTKPLQEPAQGKQSYLQAIHYTDDVVRDLLEGMANRSLLKNTIVLITGDHGEGFAEHGQIAHNGTAYEEGMHVPLIVYAPEFLQGARRIGGLRQHIDILPSLLNLIGSRHDGSLPGKDLFSDERGHEEIITSCFYNDYCLNHYRDDGTKMLYFFGKRPSEVYDLRTDPMEKENLAPKTAPEQLKERLEQAATLKKSFSQFYPN